MAKTKKRISILCIGEIHRDPAALLMINSYIEKLTTKENIRVVYCEEGEPNLTLEKKLRGNLQLIKQNELVIKGANLKGFFTKVPELYRPFIKLETVPKIAENIKLQNPNNKIINKYAEYYANFIAKHLIFEASILLIGTLQKLNIPFFSFQDVNISIDEDLKDRDIYLNAESSRINSMVHNVVTKAIPAIGDGGVIFCRTGNNHIHSFAAHLKYALSQGPNFSEYEIKIIPIELFSGYSLDGLKNFELIKSEAQQNAPKHIQELYKTFHAKRIICAENPENGEFSSPELDKIISDASDFIKRKMNRFLLPSINDEIQGIIKDLGGRILEGNVIEVESGKLLAPVRTKLGIGRLRITLDRETEEQLKYLKKYEAITIESELESNKFLVTFPKDLLPIVDGVVNNWENQKNILPKELESTWSQRITQNNLSSSSSLGF